MSKTYRNRQRVIGYYQNKEHYTQRLWYNWRTGEHEALRDESDWERYGRDKSYNGGRCRSFRQDSNKIIRNKNRVDVRRIMNDPENYENMTFATKQDGKPLIWVIW